MEVGLRPPFGGCLMVGLAVMTLGLYPLLRRWMERRFIARMDDQGFETRGGERVSWGEVTRIEHRIGEVSGAKLSDEYLVSHPKGRSSLALWRAPDANAALDYMIQRAPQEAWVKE
jgi:hypothetical protein